MTLRPLILNEITRTEFYRHCADGIPEGSECYWHGQVDVPANLDLYPAISKITNVDIEIDSDQIFTGMDLSLKVFECHEAYVHLSTPEKVYSLGLHLFPTYRFGEDKITPDTSLKVHILKSGSKTKVDLPDNISSALLHCLIHGKPRQSSCIQFTNDLFERAIGSHKHTWKCRLDEETKPADQLKFAIALPGRVQPLHSAIALSSDFTLSQLKGTCLRVMTTDQIVQFFNPNVIERSYFELDM